MCKLKDHLTTIIELSKEHNATANIILTYIKDMSEFEIAYKDLEKLNWLVSSLEQSNNLKILGNIHMEPDCAICTELSKYIRK